MESTGLTEGKGDTLTEKREVRHRRDWRRSLAARDFVIVAS